MPIEPVVRGGRIVYEPVPDRLQEVGEAYPAPAVKAAAETALRAAVADLGLPASTRIIWCVEEGESSRKMRQRYGETPWRAVETPVKARGMVEPADPTALWVVASQTPEAVAETVRHECRHSWQLQTGAYRWAAPELATMELRESDAAAYAASRPPAPAPRSSAPSRPAPATRTRSYPSVREAAMAARRAGYFEHKGRQSSRCEHCDEITPLNTTHRCPVAALWRPW